jgi:hypothetical protein
MMKGVYMTSGDLLLVTKAHAPPSSTVMSLSGMSRAARMAVVARRSDLAVLFMPHCFVSPLHAAHMLLLLILKPTSLLQNAIGTPPETPGLTFVNTASCW